ncbi:mucin-3A-like isoform X2 [Oncorhynchus tshawytscha]|uniref:mucin-3A-like isoform X2 n=1 Tax=Oncorhynchus tshawytscha TaxID=74940 RepID=UPI001C3D3EF9|nr:mucin-3A-like isoform X2 [Oncorhynchus tshawytscha]
MKIIHVISCCLLSALCVVESAGINVMGVVGRQVKINCSYSWAEDNDKYFCKESCSKKDILIQSDGKQNYKNKDRFSILNTINGVFTVTITKLEKSDSGKYWCGVNRLLKDTYTEVHLKVTDAPPTSTPSPVTSRPHVSTTIPNLSTTSANLSATFLASGENSGHSSSRAGLMVWTSAGLVVMVTVLGLVLLLFYRQRRGTRRTPPPPVSSNTQPDPAGEVVCVYEEIREADRQTDTLPVVISVVYSTVKSPNNSTTYPADQASTTYPADQASTTYPAGQASTTYPAGQASTTYPAGPSLYNLPCCQASTTYPAGQASTTYPAGQASTTYPAGQASTTYPAGQASTTYPTGHSSTTYPAGQASTTYPASSATDSRVSSSPPTASGTQDDSIYSTAQLPKDTVESTRYPAVHLSKDTPEDALYSTAQLPKDTVESTRYPAVHLSKDTPEDVLYSTAQLPTIM